MAVVPRVLLQKVVPWVLLAVLLVIVATTLGWLLSAGERAALQRQARLPAAAITITADNYMDRETFAAYLDEMQRSMATASLPDRVARRTDTPVEALAEVSSGLLEPTAFGPLPRIADDGIMPWQYYAAPAGNTGTPKVAVVLLNLGLNPDLTRTIIQQAPVGTTLAFSPYASNLEQWMAEARAKGFECLLMLPMEPTDYPQRDPGAKALLTQYTAAQTQEALKWLMGRGTGYTGMISVLGNAFTEQPARLRPVLETFRQRGLLFVDATTPRGQRTSAEIAQPLNLPYVATHTVLEQPVATETMVTALQTFTQQAEGKPPQALAMMAYPPTVAALQQWYAATTAALIPVSALATSP